MFKELLTEGTDTNLKIIKEIQKRYKVQKTPVRYKKDFDAENTFDMETKEMGKIRVQVNVNDYNRPVFDYETI